MISAESINIAPLPQYPDYDMHCPQAGGSGLNFYQLSCCRRECPTCKSRPVPYVGGDPVIYDDPDERNKYRRKIDIELNPATHCRFCGDPLPEKKLGKVYSGRPVDFCDKAECRRKRKRESWANGSKRYRETGKK